MLAKVGITATRNLETGAYFTGLGSKPADAYFFNWLWLDFPRIPVPPRAVLDVLHLVSGVGTGVRKPSPHGAYAANDKQLEAAARQIQLTVAENLPVILYVPHA